MDYTNQYPIDSGGLGVFFLVYMVVVLALAVISMAGMWKMYAKAGRPGWAAIIPFYNWWVWVDIIERPRWWFWAMLVAGLFSWIPLLGIALSIGAAVLYLLACLDMAKRFGQGAGTGIGLWILPFIFAPLLGFGSARFDGGAGPGAGMSVPAWPAELRSTDSIDDAFPEPTAMSADPYRPAPESSRTVAPPYASDDDYAGDSSERQSSPIPSFTPAPAWGNAVQAPYVLAPRTSPIAPLGFRAQSTIKS